MKGKEPHIRVKICGLTNLQDARFVSGEQVHFIGFIFYNKSPRYIDPAKAGAIINWVEGPKSVGVFVNQPLDDVNMIARETGVDLIQLHGDESPEYCELIEKPVIKAIRVGRGDTGDTIADRIEPYLPHIKYLLFDTKIEGLWGGTGKTFDWAIVREVSNRVPFFLSGGIGTENVASACATAEPYAIDLSSSLESEPGVKDFNKIETFMGEIRNIWRQENEAGDIE